MCWVMPPASRAGYVGLPYGVEQRRLSVVDVTHDGDHRRAPHQILRLFSQLDVLRALLFVTDLVGGCAKLARQLFGQLDVEGLVDGGENLSFPPVS